jgi:peptide/nickel transport system ATP-binding protein
MTEVISAPTPLGAPPPDDVLLEVRDLRTYFHVLDGTVPAVDGVSYTLKRGKSLGIVGESGSGKSVSALTMMRLLDIPPAEIRSGEIWFDGKELLSMPMEQMRKLRGNDMAMIFQEPLTSLNPVFTIGDQIAEQVQRHKKVGRKAAWERAIESLQLVGIPSPERRVKQYPHEMSGGMRQRVMIAMALSCEPKLLIADEPTTALDVTIQAQILDLMRNLREQTGTAIILITHDLGVVAEMCDRVAVMYAGEIVEQTDVTTLFRSPRHPYTRGLIGSIPVIGDVREQLSVIPGNVPNLIDVPKGCRFAPRCASRVAEDNAMAIDVHPGLHPLAVGHEVRCWLYHDANGRPIPRPAGWVPRTDVTADEVLATGAAADAGAAAAGTTALPGETR